MHMCTALLRYDNLEQVPLSSKIKPLTCTVVTIVIETLFPVPLPDVAQYRQIPFPVPTG